MMVEPNRLPDWRIGLSGEVAKDSGQFKAGEILYFMTEIATPNRGTLQVPVPSPVRLALNIAVRSARSAQERRTRADFLTKPGRKVVANDAATLAFVYDFIEDCMAAATSSHLALEAHVNDIIGRRLGSRELELKRRGGNRTLNAEEIQRQLSTEEKLSTVLPAILDVRIDKGSKTWREFKVLQKVRDAVTHFKTHDHALRGGKVDRDTVFYSIFRNSPLLYPRATLGMMRQFAEYNTHEVVEHVETQLDA